MSLQTFDSGTSILTAMPWGNALRARVLCPDGVVRQTKRLGYPDTAFSQPAAISYRGHTVSGFLTFQDDLHARTRVLTFTATGKYADIFGD